LVFSTVSKMAPTPSILSGLLLVLLVAAALVAAVEPVLEKSSANAEDSNRDMIALVHSVGYHLEEHFVQTEDGYLLGLFRLKRSGQPDKTGGKVALLMHGLLDSAVVYLNNGVERSLGYLLVEQGYDVWLGNNRGNTWSKRHVNLKVDSNEFWDFTFDEMAEFDVPALVDHVLEHTKMTSLTYIGHSQGSTQLVAALSTEKGRTRLASKINKFIGLAPAIYVNHMSSLLMKAMATLDLDQVTELLGVRDFAPSNKVFETLLPGVCRKSPRVLCENMLDMVYGPSSHLNIAREEVFLSQFPAGTSARNVAHWGQHTRHNRFGKFNYGAKGNLVKYGRMDAPDYDLSSFPKTLDATFYFGSRDALQTEPDRDRARKELPENVKFVVIEGYSHVDFVWGKDPERFVFPDLLQRMTTSSSKPAEDSALDKAKRVFLRATAVIQ